MFEIGTPQVEIEVNEDESHFIFIDGYEDYGLSDIAERFANEYLGFIKPTEENLKFYKLDYDLSEENILSKEEADVAWRTEVLEKRYTNNEYNLIVKNLEIYVGASSGYEQIYLAIISGTAAGATAFFIQAILQKYKDRFVHRNHRDKQELIISFLKVRYGVTGRIIFDEEKKTDNGWYYKVRDISKDILFELNLTEQETITLLKVKQLIQNN